MIGDIKESRQRMDAGLLAYQKKVPNGKDWSERKVILGYKGEVLTSKRLEKIEAHQENIRVENNIPFGNGNIDHLIRYKNGSTLILDSKNWNVNYNTYLNNLNKELLKESNFLQQTRHIRKPYVGIVFHGKYIPGGIEKTDFGFFILNPNFLGKFIKEIGKK